MKLVTTCNCPPIPTREFDWEAYDDDQMSGICGDPDCSCRQNLVCGFGETEEMAIRSFVSAVLDFHGISVISELQPLRNAP